MPPRSPRNKKDKTPSPPETPPSSRPHFRREYISPDEQDIRQALADWFQVSPIFSPTRNIHSIPSLLGAILSRLPLSEKGVDEELLRDGWAKAVGPFLSQQAHLLSITKGVAIIQVLQPAMRYQLLQCQIPLLGKLKEVFGDKTVRSIKIRIG